MDEKSIERLLARFGEGNLTEEEHREFLALVRAGTHTERINALLYENQLRYVESDGAHIQHTLTEAEQRSAEQRRARTLDNIREIIQKERKAQDETVVPLYRVWTRVAAAAALVVATVTGGYWYYTSQQAAAYLAHTRIFEDRQFIHLPDGSTATLNGGSRLSYHDSFGDTVREVSLTGEAFFDVAHNPSKPFRVRTGSVTTTVLGTAFNVHAYPEEKNVTVTVARGKVKVSNAKDEFQVITPNEQLLVNQTTHAIARASMKAEVATEWKSSFLILDNITLQEAASMISQKYQVQVVVEDEIRDCKIQGSFVNNESLTQVLDVMSLLIQGSFSRQDSVITLNGKGCN